MFGWIGRGGGALLKAIRRGLQYDWRVTAIFLAALFSFALTYGLYVFAANAFFGFDALIDVARFPGAVFAGWVGGLLGFAFFGLVVAIVSLIKPESAEFDARARILFRAQSGAHIEYIIDRMKRVFEHYATRTKIIVVFERYDAASGLFFIAETQKTTIKNYIEDITSSYSSKMRLQQVTPAPAGGESNKLAFLRIDDKAVCDPREFTSAIEQEFDAKVNRGEKRSIAHCVKIWFKANDEDNEYTPIRYTQQMSLKICNNLPNDIKLRIATRNETIEVTVPKGGREKVLNCNDLVPGEAAYTFKASPIP